MGVEVAGRDKALSVDHHGHQVAVVKHHAPNTCSRLARGLGAHVAEHPDHPHTQLNLQLVHKLLHFTLQRLSVEEAVEGLAHGEEDVEVVVRGAASRAVAVAGLDGVSGWLDIDDLHVVEAHVQVLLDHLLEVLPVAGVELLRDHVGELDGHSVVHDLLGDAHHRHQDLCMKKCTSPSVCAI